VIRPQRDLDIPFSEFFGDYSAWCDLNLQELSKANQRRFPAGDKYHSPGQGKVSTTSFAAALGIVTNIFIGRTEDSTNSRRVAEAEINRTLLLSRTKCRLVSASAECGWWQHFLLGRPDQMTFEPRAARWLVVLAYVCPGLR